MSDSGINKYLNTEQSVVEFDSHNSKPSFGIKATETKWTVSN